MRIILIGFMGVGKTTIGKIIAKKLKLNFVDMDNYIEKREGKSISKIFEEYGEQHFRELESESLKDLIKIDNIVISTGGGIITTKENSDILKKEKIVIFLDANTQTILNNLYKEIDKRPLLSKSNNVENTISNLLNERYEKYNSICDIKIDINEKNIEEVVSQILVNIG